MNSYRLYLYDGSGTIQGRLELTAEDDLAGLTVAENLCDACSDVCASFELWAGPRCVGGSSDGGHRPRLGAAQIAEKTQIALIRCEEAIRESHWAVGRSQRLVERLDLLRAQRP